uniref:Uncharacterized protein n=1 Tax=viral metagenome TaxID=1070528 RepID=A0A6M3LGN9_9ZZZZ
MGKRTLISEILGSIPVRTLLYEGELEYFKKNPHVTGMAAEDDHVILNPFSYIREEAKANVIMNEKVRILMRQRPQLRPAFGISQQQKEQYAGYGNEQDIKDTIAARALSGDPSSGFLTREQQRFKDAFWGKTKGLLGLGRYLR